MNKPYEKMLLISEPDFWVLKNKQFQDIDETEAAAANEGDDMGDEDDGDEGGGNDDNKGGEDDDDDGGEDDNDDDDDDDGDDGGGSRHQEEEELEEGQTSQAAWNQQSTHTKTDIVDMIKENNPLKAIIRKIIKRSIKKLNPSHEDMQKRIDVVKKIDRLRYEHQKRLRIAKRES